MKSMKMLGLTVLALAMAGLQAKTPMEIDFKLAAEKRFQLDGIIPLSADAYWPGAQYLATVTTLPATLKFVTVKGEEVFRYEVKAGDARLPAVPFDLALFVAGNCDVTVFTRKDGQVKLLGLARPNKGCDLRTASYTRDLRFRAEGGAKDLKVALSAGIGQADIRFVTTGRENRPYTENGRFFFTFSSRGWGTNQGIMSIDPHHPNDLRLEGTLFFDYGDGLIRNDTSSDLFYDDVAGEWRAYVSNFSTGIGSSGTGKREPGGVNIARCKTNPLHGANVMKVTRLGLSGMNEDPDGIWDAEAGKWRLLLSEFSKGIRASMWESEKWNGPFTRIAGPVSHDSTGTTIFPMDGKRYVLSGSSERACYVYSYPDLQMLGKLKFDTPPWPTTGKGGPHGRVWPAVAEFTRNGKPAYLMVTMDRINFPGMPRPNWTYGKLMIYVGE